ncbi:hypothetical protein QE152_g32349 [Popillia japonica]|uniref:Uncharacterized protein n=1 Tax=Popillia japonica TaxID=7064 RepID=A0AAW1IZB6_POPJA
MQGNHPYRCDARHPNFNQNEDHGMMWDTIAADIYQDEWDNLTYAEKAKRAKFLQSKVTPDKCRFRAKRRTPSDASGSDAQSSEPTPGNSRNNLTAEDVQEQEAKSTANPSTANNEVVADEDQKVLLWYLLPTYKLLNSTDKPDVLHECYNLMKTGQKDTTNVRPE